ncbi:malonyl-CoA decarboxylase [Marinobacter sp.]
MTFLQELLPRTVGSLQKKAARNQFHETRQEISSLEALKTACESLMQDGGEASRIAVAEAGLKHYANLSKSERKAFFHLLLNQYSADSKQIHEAYAKFRENESNAALQTLFETCEPRRQNLLRRLNLCPGGTFELVKMRADLLELLRENPDLAPIDSDFSHLFASWFNRGFLILESIDWNTPAAILEKIVDYEAVHAIRDWKDLRNRLDPQDRRCYAFFHPAIGVEPLIFVEVALCRGIPDNVQGILQTNDKLPAHEADTAVFYSISNCQRGLKGISFGNFLIKQVVQELKREFSNLEQFVTLSPLPGFAKWLHGARESESVFLSPGAQWFVEKEQWPADQPDQPLLASELKSLAAGYLLDAKHSTGTPLDPVARFHLGNGASLHRINWAGDVSGKGLRQAHGLMVNYRYELNEIEQNHEAFSKEGVVVCAPEIRRLANRKSRSTDAAANV